MEIRYKPVWFWLGVAVLVAGFWLTFWQPGPFDESPLYAFGPLLLAGGSVLAAMQLSVRSISDLEQKTAPAEVDAWLSLVYIGAIGAWVLEHRDWLQESWLGAQVKHASLHLLMLVVFYLVVSAVMRARRGKVVLEDERDRDIKQRATAWGRGVLIGGVVVLMLVLGLSPGEKLQWATHAAIAYHLWLALLLGWLVQGVVTVAMYVRDRRA